ncbi:TPA: hypothetical protein N0F65_002097 [Lagenidium giganteum]|uniref:Uncharacterized protein n=1 Tax=Lagenidium giganteum TaxID=4803 RepID=A0AAV2ZEH9_9STRA|nr:TPA: hypothetical protein N0F65_002097 [Lagenidium giganteum]
MLAIRRAAVAAQKRALAPQFQVARLSADAWKDKEHAAEAAFFNKQDEKALRKLLKKLKQQSDVVDAKGLKDHVKHDTEGLKQIKGLNLTNEQVEALLKWKHEH